MKLVYLMTSFQMKPLLKRYWELQSKMVKRSLADGQEVFDSVIHGTDKNREEVMDMKNIDFSPLNSYMGI